MTPTTRRARPRAALRRTFAAVAVLPALLLPLTACGGGDDDGGGKSGGNSGGSSGESQGGDSGKGGEGDGGKGDGGTGTGGGKGDETDKPDKGSAKPLTERQLRTALLNSEDAPGYRVNESRKALDDDPPEAGPECRPLIDLFSKGSEQKRTASVAAGLLKGGKDQFTTGSTIHQVLLSAYRPGDAETFLGNLKTGAEKCPKIEDKPDGTGKREKVVVEPQPSPGMGDDSVRFGMTNAKNKPYGVQVTVVRSGANTMTFMSTSLTGKGPEQPKRLIDKQLAKLEAAGKG
ncbi:hypothetical protein [Streptomyces spirodelae]|uniref:Lipoprotein n=1 Tax=Streptomyces spirodelae TaxID=2812904 RepID=A0ABS3X099_9ACTN|nr:hypothetical protein [Streptomyces spirodelae]MBO8188496.1 hypothetical protein [Streptomyces spirodelae]